MTERFYIKRVSKYLNKKPTKLVPPKKETDKNQPNQRVKRKAKGMRRGEGVEDYLSMM
jgi:hypothetical protein